MRRVTPRRWEVPAPLPLRVEPVTLTTGPEVPAPGWEELQGGRGDGDSGVDEMERLQRRLQREMRRYCSWRDVQRS